MVCAGLHAVETTLTYFVYGKPSSLEVWHELCRDFCGEHKDIRVIVRHVPSYREFFSKLLTQIAAGTPPDVVFMSSTQIPAFAERGALLDLSGHLENPADFNPDNLKMFSYKGKLYALPSDMAVNVLFYNPELFDQAGVPYPNDSWKWKDLLLAARKLTVFDINGKPLQYGFVRSNPYFWIYQNGGEIVKYDKNGKLRSAFNSPRNIETIKFINDMEQVYGVTPSFSAQKDMDNIQMFKSKRIAMMAGGHWWLPEIIASGTPLGIAMLPYRKKRIANINGSGLSVMSGSKNKKEAIVLARFLSSAYAQKKMSRLNFCYPARKSVAASKVFLDSIPGVDKKAFLRDAKYSYKMPDVAFFNQIDEIVWKDLENIWTGTMNVEDAVKVIDRRINDLIKNWEK
jgi:multiple sugar transport system substrate-binding protein